MTIFVISSGAESATAPIPNDAVIATTLEANAALRAVVRRDTSEGYVTFLRGHGNILKRLLLQVCGLNLGLLMRQLTGFGTPRGLQGRAYALVEDLVLVLRRFWGLVSRPAVPMPGNWAESSSAHPMTPFHSHLLPGLQEGSSATACQARTVGARAGSDGTSIAVSGSPRIYSRYRPDLLELAVTCREC